jgi:pimeloyl-ACP methyl ester carboxylesterase
VVLLNASTSALLSWFQPMPLKSNPCRRSPHPVCSPARALEQYENRLDQLGQYLRHGFGAKHHKSPRRRTGPGVALAAAAELSNVIRAVVSRSGRPDLANPELIRVNSPTLLIVGGQDDTIIKLNKQALTQLHCEKKFEIVPGATHLCEEPGVLGSPLSNGFDSCSECPR